ncbi:hypothetical protein JCM10212_005819 [Sporobolomyces blumeae]
MTATNTTLDGDSIEHKLAGFDSVPLFMRSLPSELGGTLDDSSTRAGVKDGQTDPSDTLAALQALAYEGDPSEIAEGFRQQGNDLFKARKFRDAMGFYSRAIDECGPSLDVDERRTLYSNRAACNLELANYGACLRDCSQVLGQVPNEPTPASARTTMKALLRSARALSGLDKLDEALDALDRLRTLEREAGPPGQGAVEDSGKRWREDVERKVALKKRKALERTEKERRTREGEVAIMQALKLRGVVFPKPTTKVPLFHHCPTDVTPPHFDVDSLPRTSLPSIPYVAPDKPSSESDQATTAPYVPWVCPDPATTHVVFPVFLLLPLATPPTRDLCLEFHEHATFADALESMEHDPSQVQLYFATARGKVLKIGSKLTLAKVLDAASRLKEGQTEHDRDGWRLQEGWAFEMVGVPKTAEGEAWIQEWKKEVQAGTGAIL